MEKREKNCISSTSTTSTNLCGKSCNCKYYKNYMLSFAEISVFKVLLNHDNSITFDELLTETISNMKKKTRGENLLARHTLTISDLLTLIQNDDDYECTICNGYLEYTIK